MNAHRRQVRLGDLSAAIVLAACLSCTSWRVQNATPEQVILRDHPNRLRVVRTDSVRLVVADPRVSGDSLFGVRDHAELGMPLSEVSSVAERKFDAGKSIGLGLGIPALTLGALYLAACSGDNYYC